MKVFVKYLKNQGLESFKFHEELTQDEYTIMYYSMIDHIIRWTGGASRPLILCLHMLRAFDSSLLKSKNGLKSIFNKLVMLISKNSALKADLGPV